MNCFGTPAGHRGVQPTACGQSPHEGNEMLSNDSNQTRSRKRRGAFAVPVLGVPALTLPVVVAAQASPFLTGATALQNNVLAWLTPIAVILIMALGAMAMANRLAWGWCIGAILGIAQVATTYGEGDAHTIVENCANSMILRCSASEGGGTSRFASTLIGQREVRRTTLSHSRRPTELFGSSTRSEHFSIEPAVMDSEIEQLPDLCGYLKFASRPEWLGVRLQPADRPGAAAVENPAHIPIELPTGVVTSVGGVAPVIPDAHGSTPDGRLFPGRRRTTSRRAGAQSSSAHQGAQVRRGSRGRGADCGAAPEMRGPEP
jgi:type IV secretory pathway VirB2 component (pilin)